ncbi:MAG: hypothetical protein PHF17_00870 [Arcobacteraceae bacterium]|jgi:hypothetical protein|nr:hypothetical protein [Arcobacteraceae bacterium]
MKYTNKNNEHFESVILKEEDAKLLRLISLNNSTKLYQIINDILKRDYPFAYKEGYNVPKNIS